MNQKFNAITDNSDRIKKGFSVIVNDKDEVIGGRNNEEVEMFQPIKHLSGTKNICSSSPDDFQLLLKIERLTLFNTKRWVEMDLFTQFIKRSKNIQLKSVNDFRQIFITIS